MWRHAFLDLQQDYANLCNINIQALRGYEQVQYQRPNYWTMNSADTPRGYEFGFRVGDSARFCVSVTLVMRY